MAAPIKILVADLLLPPIQVEVVFNFQSNLGALPLCRKRELRLHHFMSSAGIPARPQAKTIDAIEVHSAAKP